jgi:hypothetical protein
MLERFAQLLADDPPTVDSLLNNPLLRYGAIAVGVLVVLLIILVALRRKPDKGHDPEAGMQEDLAAFPEPPPAGKRQVTFQGQPMRVRLVVVAPVGKQTEEGDMVPVLDKVVRGLGTTAALDQPEVRNWPLGLSKAGFQPMFFRRVRRPGPRGAPSNWVLLAGEARAGARLVLLGLALWSEEPTTIGNVPVGQDEWNELLRVEKVT